MPQVDAMIIEAGLAALWLAAAMGALQLVLAGLAAIREDGNPFADAMRTAAIVQALLAAVAVGCYGYLLLAADPFVSVEPNLALPPALATPAILALLTVVGAGALIRWRRDGVQAVEQLTWPIAAAGAVFAGLAVFATKSGWLPMLGLTLAAGLAVASLQPLRDPSRLSLSTLASITTNLGIAASLAGIASDRAFTVERQVVVGTAQPQRIGPFEVTLAGIRPTIGPNWSALEAHLTARRGDGAPFVIRPQSRYVLDPPTNTSPRATATRWDGQLYAMLGEPQGSGRWQLRLWWKPFVTLIWLGGGLIALGGLLALIGWWRRRREERA